MNWNREYKQEIRHWLFKAFTGTQAKCALMLPSHSCLCLKEGLAQGVLTPDTHIIAIEKDPNVLPNLRRNLRKLFSSFEIIPKKIGSRKADEELKFADLSRMPDFSWLDLCGQYNDLAASWLNREGSEILAKVDRPAFTFENVYRWSKSYIDERSLEVPLTSHRFANGNPQGLPSKDRLQLADSDLRARQIATLTSLDLELGDWGTANVFWGRAYKEEGSSTAMVSFVLERRLVLECGFDMGYNASCMRAA